MNESATSEKDAASSIKTEASGAPSANEIRPAVTVAVTSFELLLSSALVFTARTT
jgi:hypothetical protein